VGVKQILNRALQCPANLLKIPDANVLLASFDLTNVRAMEGGEGPYLELFARGKREGWDQWGNEVDDYYPSWPTYKNHSQRIVPVSSRKNKPQVTPNPESADTRLLF
jgi:hypothetical protein